MAALKEENSRLKHAVRTLTPLVINRAAVARDVVDVCFYILPFFQTHFAFIVVRVSGAHAGVLLEASHAYL
jgi:hypothetical protein